jgi:hypothetical protein
MTHTIVDNTTIAFDMEDVSDGISGTWTAFGSASALGQNEDIFKVGLASIDAKLDGGVSGAQGGMQITRTAAIDFDDGGTDRGMVAVWVLQNGIVGANGIRLRVGSADTAYKNYVMASLDGSTGIQYNGGWVRMVVDINQAPLEEIGSPDMANADYFAVEFDSDTDIMGNIPTIWVDQMDILTAADIAAGTPAFEVIGTTVTAGSALDEVAGLATVQDLGAIVKASNGSFDLNMPVKFGDVVASSSSTITSTNEYMFIPAHQFAAGFCTIEFDGGTGTNTATWGAESGSGDNTLGATGGAIRGVNDGTNGNFKILCDASDATTILAGVIIDGADSISLSQTNVKLVSCTMVNCGSISLDVGSGATLRDSVVTDSIAASGTGAIILVGNPAATADFRDMLIQNCVHGIENEVNGAITWDLRNIVTANNTADIRFNHTSALLTVNVLEGSSTFSTSDGGGGGTISVVASNPITITVKDVTDNSVIESAEVLVEESDGTLIVSGSTNASGVFADTTGFTGAMVFKIRKGTVTPFYIAVRRTGTVVAETGFVTEVLMTPDTNNSN